MSTELDTFPIDLPNPSYGLSGTPTFLVDKVELGDRYTRRIKRGINNKYYTWNLTWTNLSFEEMDQLRDFLEGLEGVHPFLWDHPTEGRLYKCICEEYTIAHDVFERYNISATFEEEL